jgi:hypothetical protein
MGKTFEMVEGYDAEYNKMLYLELERLVSAKKHEGITAKEDNMIYQLKTHLGIKVDLLSQRTGSAPIAEKVGIETYN